MRRNPRMILLAFIALLLSSIMLFNGVANADAQDLAIITGRVISDWDGYPMSDVDIILINPSAPDERITAATTDDAGLFTVTQAISATWVLRFEPKNPFLPPYLSEYYDDTFAIEEATLITAEVGTLTPNINASLAQVGQVSGRVTAEADGTPIANVRVTVYRANTGHEYLHEQADSSGIFTFTLEVGTRYKFRFDPLDTDPYALEFYNDQKSFVDASALRIPAETDIRMEVALALGGTITGAVTSSWLGKPLEYPYVHVLDDHGERIQLGNHYRDDYENPGPNGPPGHYAAYNLPPGSYQVQFLGERHRPLLHPELVTVEAGKTTTDINARLVISPQVTSIATSFANPNMIALTFRHDPGPLVSFNGGMNWQLISATTWVEDNSQYDYPDRTQYVGIVAGIAPRGAPGEGTRLLVAAGRALYSPGPLRTGIYRSGDNGQSWAESAIDPALDEQTCFEAEYRPPAITPADPSALYAIYRCITSGPTRLLVSHDYGVTWRDVTTIDARTLVLNLNARVIASPHIADEIYVFDGGIEWYKSTNGGIDWQTISFPVESFVFDAINPDFLSGWTTRHNAPYTRIGKRSLDGGDTWQDWVQQPCPNSFNEEPPQLIAHPTEANVVFLRCDNFETPGIYRSDSNGDFWKRLGTEKGQMLAVDYGVPGSRPARILWARDDGLWASADLGETWEVVLSNYRSVATPLYLPNVVTQP